MKTIKKIGIAIIIIIIGVAYAYGTWPRPIYNTDIGSLSYEKTDFLTTDSTMEQKFVCGNNGFSGFTIKMLKQDGQNIGNYRWTVEEVKTEEAPKAEEPAKEEVKEDATEETKKDE